MLIFLSDLHFMDGTAGKLHLDWHAFRDILAEIGRTAREAGAREIKIVLLGDIFDLIRTELWFDVDPAKRPWGEIPSEEAALHILDQIILRNRKTLAVLAEGWQGVKLPVEPEVIYLPGNHDRLCNLFPSLRQRICRILRLRHDPALPLPHLFLDEEYRTFARHGQEWDPFNFELSRKIRGPRNDEIPDADYLKTPIGDVITTEIAAKIPLVVRDGLEGHPDRERIYDNFRNLFNVRPLAAMIPWLSYEIKRYDKRMQAVCNQAIRDVAQQWTAIPFVKQWIKQHDHWLQPLDKSDQLQLLNLLIKSFEFTDLEYGLQLMDIVRQWWDGDNYGSHAVRDFQYLDRRFPAQQPFLYAVYGHTHRPDQQAVGVIEENGQMLDRVYLNTGTWRPTFQQGITRQGFVGWNNISYTLIYKPGEKKSDGSTVRTPAFQMWTGTGKAF